MSLRVRTHDKLSINQNNINVAQSNYKNERKNNKFNEK